MVIASLVLGGWLTRQRITPAEAPLKSATSSHDSDALDLLREQLSDAREESELLLLQLHQVQEELEYYFLDSRDLQQKLDAVTSIEPEQLEQLQRIRTRLFRLFAAMPSPSESEPHWRDLAQRQQKALRRFQRLHASTLQR